MIRVTHSISIEESDLDWAFCRSSGPGGQHVNTSDTAVQLRLDLSACDTIPAHVLRRLRNRESNRITEDGFLIIRAARTRSQRRNRDLAIEKLCDMIRRAATPRRKRRPTKPTRASKERRIERKKRRSAKKRLRRPPRPDL